MKQERLNKLNEDILENIVEEIEQLTKKIKKVREDENWGTYKNLFLSYKEVLSLYDERTSNKVTKEAVNQVFNAINDNISTKPMSKISKIEKINFENKEENTLLFYSIEELYKLKSSIKELTDKGDSFVSKQLYKLEKDFNQTKDNFNRLFYGEIDNKTQKSDIDGYIKNIMNLITKIADHLFIHILFDKPSLKIKMVEFGDRIILQSSFDKYTSQSEDKDEKQKLFKKCFSLVPTFHCIKIGISREDFLHGNFDVIENIFAIAEGFIDDIMKSIDKLPNTIPDAIQDTYDGNIVVGVEGNMIVTEESNCNIANCNIAFGKHYAVALVDKEFI